MPSPSLARAALALYADLEGRGLRLVLAESCTGGLASEAFTAIPGSSAFLWGGVVSYTEAAKTAILGVARDLIEAEGVVSRPVAEAMALGALRLTGLPPGACLSGAVTGYAGPGTAPGEVGPGRVCLAWTDLFGGVRSEERRFTGSREAVREAAALALLQGLRDQAMGQNGTI